MIRSVRDSFAVALAALPSALVLGALVLLLGACGGEEESPRAPTGSVPARVLHLHTR